MSKNNENEDIEKLNELKGLIESYLDEFVKIPAIETVEKDIYARDKIADLILLLNIINKFIIIDGSIYNSKQLQQLSLDERKRSIAILKEFRNNLEEIKHKKDISQEVLPEIPPGIKMFMKSISTKKHLIAYIKHELNWVAVSILSTSYISANITMRSVFELLVPIATNQDGGMGGKIDSISYLIPEENKKLKGLWDELNGWAHPNFSWEKKVCPVFISYNPMYHPALCKQSLELFEKIIDFFIIISLEIYEININDVFKEIQIYNIDISNLTLVQRRLQ